MSDAIAILASIPSPLKDRMEETSELLLLSRPEVVKVAKKEKINVDASASRDDIVGQIIQVRIGREFVALTEKSKEAKPEPKPKRVYKKRKKS